MICYEIIFMFIIIELVRYFLIKKKVIKKSYKDEY